MTYSLAQSFSNASHGTGHSLLSPIIPIMCWSRVCCQLQSLRTYALEADTCVVDDSGLSEQLACCTSP